MKTYSGEDAVEHTAAWIADRLRASIAGLDRPAVLALPGGRSIAAPLAALKRHSVDWSRVVVFLVDERFVPADDIAANAAAVRGELSRLRGFDHSALHVPALLPPAERDPEACALEYSEQLRKAGGRFDIAVIGVGEDGHIASLFPRRTELALKGSGYVAVSGAPKPPPRRITATAALLRASGSVALLFFGSAKLQALKSFLDDRTSVNECPARLLASENEENAIFCDQGIDDILADEQRPKPE